MARKLKNINGPWYAGIDLEAGFAIVDISAAGLRERVSRLG